MTATDGRPIDVTAAPYRAVGDGRGCDQAALQRALDDAAGSGVPVTLPAGRTFVAGHLRIAADTTLVINGTLRQSDDPATYGYSPARGHDLPGGQTLPYHLGSRQNLPLLHASRVQNVTITGSGTIQMMGGHDDDVINVAPVGLYQVENFEISNLRIRDSHSWMVMVYVSRRGVVRDMDLASGYRNSDGVCILNSQQVTVSGNRMRIDDDGVYVRTEYDSRVHRPDIHWYSTRWPVPSTGILVCDNDIVSKTRGFAFIPWGAGAPDQNAIEISDITVRNNRLEAMLPVSSWTDDPTNGRGFVNRKDWQENASNYDNHVPIKDVTITANTCIQTGTIGRSSAHTDFRHLSKITNLRTDLPFLSWPGTDYDPEGFDSALPNGDFELGGLAYWSSAGTTGVVTPQCIDAIPDPDQRQAADSLFRQPLAWGPTGFLSGVHGPARLFQGLGLKHISGSDITWYEFSVELVTSGAGVLLTARHAESQSLLASRTIGQGPSRVSLLIPLTETSNPVEVGTEVAAGEANWALVRDAHLRQVTGPPTD